MAQLSRLPRSGCPDLLSRARWLLAHLLRLATRRLMAQLERLARSVARSRSPYARTVAGNLWRCLQGVRRRIVDLRPRSREEAAQGVRRIGDLRPRSREEALQGVRRNVDLRAQSRAALTEEPVQGVTVRRIGDLRAQSPEEPVQGVRRIGDLRAHSQLPEEPVQGVHGYSAW
jgi:hypothetical protein